MVSAVAMVSDVTMWCQLLLWCLTLPGGVCFLTGTSSWVDFADPAIRKWWAESLAFDKYKVRTDMLNGFHLIVYVFRALHLTCSSGMI